MEKSSNAKKMEKTKKKYYLIKLRNLIKSKQVNFKKRASLFPYSQVRKISKLKEKDLPRTTVRVQYIETKKYFILSISDALETEGKISSEEFDIAQIATIILHTKKYMEDCVSSRKLRKIVLEFAKEIVRSDVSEYEKVFDKYATMVDDDFDKAYKYLELSLSSLKEINALMKKYIRNQKVTESQTLNTSQDIMNLLTTKNIQNIIFDLGGVIVQYDHIEKDIQSYIYRIKSSENTSYDYDQIHYFCHQCVQSMKMDETPQNDILSENELVKKIYNQFPKDDEFFNRFLMSLCKTLHIGPFDFAHQLLLIANNFYMNDREKETLTYLKQSGFHLYYLSNWGRWSFEQMTSQLPLKDYLPEGIVSYDVMCNKPDKKIYLALLDKYHLQPSQCLFIDDKEENVQAAKQLGMCGLVENPQSHDIMNALHDVSYSYFKNHVSLELEKYFESNSYIKLNQYFLENGGHNMTNDSYLTEQNYIDIIQLLQEEVDECYDEIIGVDNYTVEGANIDARKAFYEMKKQYTKENKELKAALKAEDYKKARVHLKNCKKIINDFNKSLDMMDLDSISATILGILLKQLIWFARRLVLTLIFGLISAPIAAAAAIPIAKMANSSPDYTNLFGVLKQPKVSATKIAVDTAVSTGATVASIITFVQWIIATVVPLIKTIVNKQGDIDPSDFNTNLIEIKSYADTYMKHLDKMDTMISKLESAYAKDTKASKKASMKKESVDALQAYKNKLYSMCVNGEISIYEREHLLKDFEDQLYYLEASSDYDDFSPNTLPTLDNPMDSDNPQVLHPHCDMDFDDSITVSPEEKFHRVKCALYHKCEDGEIDIPTRERLIALARDKYFGESDEDVDDSSLPDSEQDIDDDSPFGSDTGETD